MKKKWNRWLFPLGRGTSKFEKVMRLMLIFVVVVYFQATAGTYSQTQKVDLKLKNASLTEALKIIQQSTGVDIYFQSEMMPEARNITVDKTDASVTEVLSELLSNTGLTFKMIDDNVVIVPIQSVGQLTEAGQVQYAIKGMVTDDKGEPLPGVNVFDKQQPSNG
ncbi:MAG: hypothetical protein JEZ14_22295, partial [Marinilabiliaceae bacterium]|nr:hypothetical protein [Marinilabiliaceae bacterium]